MIAGTGKNHHLHQTIKLDRIDKISFKIKESVDVAKRCNAKWMVVVPGLISHNVNIAYQKGKGDGYVT